MPYKVFGTNTLLIHGLTSKIVQHLSSTNRTNEPNPWGLSMPALQYNVLPHLPKVNKEQARMQNYSQLTVRVGWVGVGLLLLNSPTKLIAVQQ